MQYSLTIVLIILRESAVVLLPSRFSRARVLLNAWIESASVIKHPHDENAA
jgi:hypothetical protein